MKKKPLLVLILVPWFSESTKIAMPIVGGIKMYFDMGIVHGAN